MSASIKLYTVTASLGVVIVAVYNLRLPAKVDLLELLVPRPGHLCFVPAIV